MKLNGCNYKTQLLVKIGLDIAVYKILNTQGLLHNFLKI